MPSADASHGVGAAELKQKALHSSKEEGSCQGPGHGQWRRCVGSEPLEAAQTVALLLLRNLYPAAFWFLGGGLVQARGPKEEPWPRVGVSVEVAGVPLMISGTIAGVLAPTWPVLPSV